MNTLKQRNGENLDMDSAREQVRQAGYSLVELSIVVIILLVVSAFAMPTLLTALGNMRLRSSASDVAALIQEIRMRAVRDNRFQIGACRPTNDCNLAWLDLDRGGNPDPLEPQLQLSGGVRLVPDGSGNPALPQATVGFAPTSNVPPAFNPSGMPCLLNNSTPSLATVCSSVPPAGFAYFLRAQGTSGVAGWAAVSVSPAGRVRVWTWSGTQWR